MADKCVHRWVLESPKGPTSKGVCKDCKDTRIFPNSIEQAIAWTTSAKRKEQKEKLEKLNRKSGIFTLQNRIKRTFRRK